VPLANASADGVIASLVLHHAARPEVAVREMARILAPGGRAVVVDFLPHREDWLKDEEGDVWPGFDPKALHGWFGQAGFGEILIEEGPAPISSGRRDRPGADRRLRNLRLQWVEAVRTDTPTDVNPRPVRSGRADARKTVSSDSKRATRTQPRTRR